MNSSKKILNQQKQDKDKKKSSSVSVPDKKAGTGGLFAGRDVKPIILSVLCVVVVLVLCIGVGIQQFKPKVVVTIGDKKLTMNDMMFPIYEVERAYLPYNEVYESYYGTSVWDAAYQGTAVSASGVSNSVGLKQEVIDNEVQYEILYEKAVKEKYTLSEDDKKEAEEQAEAALKGLSWGQKLQLNISKRKLVDRFEKRALANKYREDRQEELNKGVDEKEAVKDISEKEYRQYDVQYYYASLKKQDDDGNQVDRTDAEKKELREKFKNIEKDAKDGKDFKKLISDKETDIILDDDTNFTEQGGFPYLSADNLKKVKKMKNGSISEAFLDDKTGYYVIMKMINNNSDEAYKTACDNAIKTAQDEAYKNWYEKEQEAYKIEINSDIWSDVSIGTVTTDIVTLEDLQEMMEDSSGAEGSSEE
ncbi:MAG: hypothetical protein HFH73_05490 [Lachnospiraceae bacterium]|jgi:hypothetical protein|nr:hypothetical protein [Lachnospiraceae bacterium]